MTYSQNQLAQLWVKAGGPSKLAGLMAKIAGRESSGQPHATNTSSGAAGLWQINPAAWRNDPTLGPLFRSGAIYTPEGNAKAAAYVYQRQGLKAWATYNPATDAKYIGQAAQTASAGKSYGSSPSPRSVAPATGDARTQIALSLLGMGNLLGGGYGGQDSLTQSLIAAAQQRKAPQAQTPQGPTAYGGAPISGSGYPLGKRGKLIGTPFAGTHAVAFNTAGGSNNWQSERAVDIAVPVGTPVYAEESGTLGNTGSLGMGGRFAGLRTNLIGKSNSYYYAHMSKLGPGIRAGARVQKGQLLGYTGEANGVAHLHFAVEKGDPRNYLK